MTCTDEDLRKLYRNAAHFEQPSRADHLAVRRAISAATAVGISTVAAGASASGVQGLLAQLVAVKFSTGILIGAAIGTTISATAYVVESRMAAPSVATAPSARPGPPLPGRRIAPPERVKLPAPVVAVELPTKSVSSPAEARAMARPKTVATALPTPSDADGLMEESADLARVQAALSQGNAETAIALLGEQRAKFASGKLTEERAAAEVIALCFAGRYEQASGARSRFVARYPGSPLVKRVNESCKSR